jgi:hypothetical protein
LKSWTLSGVSRGWETLWAGPLPPVTERPSNGKALKPLKTCSFFMLAASMRMPD